MQATDVFESFKAVGSIYNIEATGEAEDSSTPTSAIQKLWETFQRETKDENVVLWFIKAIYYDNGVAYINRHYPPFVNPNFSVISNGNNFFLLVDYIRFLTNDSFLIEEGECRRIVKITVISKEEEKQ